MQRYEEPYKKSTMKEMESSSERYITLFSFICISKYVGTYNTYILSEKRQLQVHRPLLGPRARRNCSRLVLSGFDHLVDEETKAYVILHRLLFCFSTPSLLDWSSPTCTEFSLKYRKAATLVVTRAAWYLNFSLLQQNGSRI